MDYINELRSHIEYSKTTCDELSKGLEEYSKITEASTYEKDHYRVQEYRELLWREGGKLSAFERALELAEKAGVK